MRILWRLAKCARIYAAAAGWAVVFLAAGPGARSQGLENARIPKTAEVNFGPALAQQRIAKAFVTGIRAAAGDVFLLVQSGFTEPSEMRLIRASMAGAVVYGVRLGVVVVRDWYVNTGGGATVNLESADGNEVEIVSYDAEGRRLGRVSSLRQEYFPTLSEAAPFRLLSSGDIVPRDGATGRAPLAHVRLPESGGPRVVLGEKLPDNRIAVVDGIGAEVTIVDLNTGSHEARELRAPEIDAARRYYQRYPPQVRGSVVAASASDEVGNIYCLVTAYRPAEGAPVLMLGRKGNERVVLRCPIGRRDGGVLVTTSLAASGNELYLADRAGLVMVYKIPEIFRN